MNQLYLDSYHQGIYLTLLEEAKLPDLSVTRQIEHANIILADPPRIAPKLEHAHQLRWLQSTFAGCDALLSQPRQDYCLTNIKGIFGALMSEYIFGQLLTLTRHLHIYRTQQTQKQWQALPYQGIKGKTVCILGTGSIGQHIASTAKHFGLRVLGINRHAQSHPNFDHVYASHQYEIPLSLADFIISVLPATSETRHFLDKNKLRHCRDAILFNVGRGCVITSTTLVESLSNGWLRHAVLDVFEQEPLPNKHPFWQHPQITMTPHISAESFPEDVFKIFKENYTKWLSNVPLNYQVDFSRGY